MNIWKVVPPLKRGMLYSVDRTPMQDATVITAISQRMTNVCSYFLLLLWYFGRASCKPLPAANRMEAIWCQPCKSPITASRRRAESLPDCSCNYRHCSPNVRACPARVPTCTTTTTITTTTAAITAATTRTACSWRELPTINNQATFPCWSLLTTKISGTFFFFFSPRNSNSKIILFGAKFHSFRARAKIETFGRHGGWMSYRFNGIISPTKKTPQVVRESRKINKQTKRKKKKKTLSSSAAVAHCRPCRFRSGIICVCVSWVNKYKFPTQVCIRPPLFWNTHTHTRT